jgi:thiosulfate/3-mercaptopyruvate sulfurtransferase
MHLPRRAFLTGILSGLLTAACRPKGEGVAAEEPLGPLLAPASLASRLEEVKAGRIAVLYVGPDMLFAHGHVPGARKLKALDSDEGRRALTTELAKIPADTEIVLYCGCCPVRNCPNVRPASAAVRALGRANAHVLDLPTRFAADWTEKGYPVERG